MPIELGSPQIAVAIPFLPLIGLEVEPQCHLASTVSAIFRGLRGLQRAERARVAHARRGWRKVGVVENVREGRFEAQPQSFADGHRLRQPRVDCNGSGPLQNADACVSDAGRTCRCGLKGV